MVFKTGLIQNTTYRGAQTTGFTWGLKRDYLIIFRFQEDIFPCFSFQPLRLETLSLALRFFSQWLGSQMLSLNAVDLIIKTGIPCRMCFSLQPGWFPSLANRHFSLKIRRHMLCLDVDVCSSLDHGWDWDVVLLSTLTFLFPSRCFFVSLTFHIYTVKRNAFCLPISFSS